MSDLIGRASARRLPSADWVAFGVGLGAMAASTAWPAATGVVLLAVILPSILREVGVLGDGDEFTNGVMHRAGFHAIVVLTVLMALNHLLPAARLAGSAENGATELFPRETLFKGLVFVFLISYLLQYWGARDGSVRVLLGTAVLTLASLPLPMWHLRHQVGGPGLVLVAAAPVAIGLLALLVRSRPRLGGALLLAVVVAFVALMGLQLRAEPRATVGLLNALFQIALIFGATGVALLWADRGGPARR